jgi:hypothetical protein
MSSSSDRPAVFSYQFLSQVQAASGLAVSGFTVVHIANSVLALGGPHLYDEVQDILRSVYQHRTVELALGTAIVVHAAASALKMRRRGMGVDKLVASTVISFEDKVHRLTGYLLLGAVGVHVVATRIGPDFLWANAFDNFGKSALVHHSLQGVQKVVMLPYYTLLLFAGTAHTFTGVRRAVAFIRDERRVTVVDEAEGRPTGLQTLAYSQVLLLCALVAFRFTDPMFDNSLARHTLAATSLLNVAQKSVSDAVKSIGSVFSFNRVW